MNANRLALGAVIIWAPLAAWAEVVTLVPPVPADRPGTAGGQFDAVAAVSL